MNEKIIYPIDVFHLPHGTKVRVEVRNKTFNIMECFIVSVNQYKRQLEFINHERYLYFNEIPPRMDFDRSTKKNIDVSFYSYAELKEFKNLYRCCFSHRINNDTLILLYDIYPELNNSNK